MVHLLLIICVEVTAFSALALVMLLTMLRPSREARRVFGLTHASFLPEPVQKRSRWLQAAQIFRFLRTRLGFRENERLRQRLIAAGHAEPGVVDTYFGMQLLGPLAAILVGSFIRENMAFWMTCSALLAYLVPDFVVTTMIRRRRAEIQLGMPDALDLMVICVEAGLGLDQALQRAGEELEISHAAIAQEFAQVNLEQRAGKGRIEAWNSMAERTKLDVIRSFTSMLQQTDRFGTPIARALIVFSDQLRLKRRQRAEELAAKTTVKLVFPLVMFIFPSIFIVLLGPALIMIVRSFGGLFHK